MISGVTSPSTLAALQSRQKTDPTVSISQTKPFPDSGTNEGNKRADDGRLDAAGTASRQGDAFPGKPGSGRPPGGTTRME